MSDLKQTLSPSSSTLLTKLITKVILDAVTMVDFHIQQKTKSFHEMAKDLGVPSISEKIVLPVKTHIKMDRDFNNAHKIACYVAVKSFGNKMGECLKQTSKVNSSRLICIGIKKVCEDFSKLQLDGLQSCRDKLDQSIKVHGESHKRTQKLAVYYSATKFVYIILEYIVNNINALILAFICDTARAWLEVTIGSKNFLTKAESVIQSAPQDFRDTLFALEKTVNANMSIAIDTIQYLDEVPPTVASMWAYTLITGCATCAHQILDCLDYLVKDASAIEIFVDIFKRYTSLMIATTELVFGTILFHTDDYLNNLLSAQISSHILLVEYLKITPSTEHIHLTAFNDPSGEKDKLEIKAK